MQITPDTDSAPCDAKASQSTETAVTQDVVVPTSLSQVTSASILALSTSPKELFTLASVALTPSLSTNMLQNWGLTVQKLRAAVERDDANLFQPLAAALDGFAKLGDNVKVCIISVQVACQNRFHMVLQGQWNADNAFAVLKAWLKAFLAIASAPMPGDAGDSDAMQNQLREMAK